MAPRLIGLETEYAIRFEASRRNHRPSNRALYDAVAGAVRGLVQTLPGEDRTGRGGRLFTESGASISYEMPPDGPDDGLVEGGTPECRSALELLQHQRGLDRLLERAAREAERQLRASGDGASLGLLKNCRDAEGHVYGAQENYEADVASGSTLFAYRLALLAAAPSVLLSALLLWALIVVFLVVIVVEIVASMLLGLFFLIVGKKAPSFVERSMEHPATMRLATPAERLIWATAGAPCLFVLWLFPFRRQRRAMAGYLCSRVVFTGAGTLERDGSFALSEKALSVGPFVRRDTRSGAPPMFDTGNLLKDLISPAFFRPSYPLRLFARRQRMQLGASDSNMAQTAEWLKVGVTALVLDMAEAGELDDAPWPLDPPAALGAIARDPSLRVKVPLSGGGEASALELQRYYLEKARRFVRARPVASMGEAQLVEVWSKTLDALERDPGKLVGVVDWVTKRWLIEACASGEPFEVQKTVDLRYHELGTGYFARLEAEGLAPRLIDDEAIEKATRQPPELSPAAARASVIREMAGAPVEVHVAWDSVRVGGRLRGKVIKLDAWRARRR